VRRKPSDGPVRGETLDDFESFPAGKRRMSSTRSVSNPVGRSSRRDPPFKGRERRLTSCARRCSAA
jgi:hypothetical protein